MRVPTPLRNVRERPRERAKSSAFATASTPGASTISSVVSDSWNPLYPDCTHVWWPSLRACDWCGGAIDASMRRDAKCCSVRCRQARHRARVSVASTSIETRRMKFAYADPPYPGLAKRYYGPEACEVNHRILIGTLERDHPDGWALSTSPNALAEVLALCPPAARVCPWVRGHRASASRGPHSAWEPLIVVRGRMRRMTAAERVEDVLLWGGGRQHSHPNSLVGQKPAAFCEWMFRLLGAEQGDELADLFPGSGAVTKAWRRFVAAVPVDASRSTSATHGETSGRPSTTPSRFEEAQSRLAEQLGDA